MSRLRVPIRPPRDVPDSARRERGWIVSLNRDANHEERTRRRAAPVSAKAAFAPKATRLPRPNALARRGNKKR